MIRSVCLSLCFSVSDMKVLVLLTVLVLSVVLITAHRGWDSDWDSDSSDLDESYERCDDFDDRDDRWDCYDRRE